MSIVVLDTFTDADGAPLATHVPELGGPWVLTSGFWSGVDDLFINSNRLDIKAQAPPVTGYVMQSPVIADGILAASVLSVGGSGFSLIFRAVDGNNFYDVKLIPPPIDLFRTVAGVRTRIGTSGAPFTPFLIEIEFIADTISIFINSSLLFSVNDSSFASGLVGLATSGSPAVSVIDDFSVDELVPCLEFTPPNSWGEVLESLPEDANTTLMIRTVDLSNGAFKTLFKTVPLFD